MTMAVIVVIAPFFLASNIVLAGYLSFFTTTLFLMGQEWWNGQDALY